MSTPNNTNAQHSDQPAETWLQFRVTRRRKAAYVRSAQRARQNLTTWSIAAMDRASGYKEPANK